MTRLASEPRRGADRAEEVDTARARAFFERFEHTRIGRALITVLLLVMFSIQLFWNIPESELRDVGVRAVRPIAMSLGFDQNWGVFAPNPRSVTLDLYAIAEYADGSTRIWQVPRHDEPFIEPYRTYRWRKWMSWARLNRYEDTLWEPAARWIMAEMSQGGQTPTQVTLVRRWYDIPAPGSGEPIPEWTEFRYFTLESG